MGQEAMQAELARLDAEIARLMLERAAKQRELDALRKAERTAGVVKQAYPFGPSEIK